MRHTHLKNGDIVVENLITFDEGPHLIEERKRALANAHRMMGHRCFSVLERVANDCALASHLAAANDACQSALKLKFAVRRCHKAVEQALALAIRARPAPGLARARRARTLLDFICELHADLLITELRVAWYCIQHCVQRVLDLGSLEADFRRMTDSIRLCPHWIGPGGIGGLVRLAFRRASAKEAAMLSTVDARQWTEFAIGLGLFPIPRTRKERKSSQCSMSNALSRHRRNLHLDGRFRTLAIAPFLAKILKIEVTWDTEDTYEIPIFEHPDIAAFSGRWLFASRLAAMDDKGNSPGQRVAPAGGRVTRRTSPRERMRAAQEQQAFLEKVRQIPFHPS